MLKGRAFKFGDNISTDHIIPGRLAHLRSNLPELAKHVMEDADPDFVSKVKRGDFIVGGNKFFPEENCGNNSYNGNKYPNYYSQSSGTFY